MRTPRSITIKEARIAELFSEIMDCIPGIDRDDPNLLETPARVARMYGDAFWGLDPRNEPKLKLFDANEHNGVIGTGRIFFSSFCAHHFMPFSGHAHIFYFPGKKVVGLSKFTRIVNYFAARPQIQERLCSQIADFIMERSGCYGCMVIMRASHSCVQCRGVRQEEGVMISSVLRPLNSCGEVEGPFADLSVRTEALAIMEMKK